ncbi:DMT family transporter [uncultured Ilyobacter sp.]|uniref:DMT family transporter n=1 Tax=uncultured Ilyobacter sp. TaxID=544433 RepID=UPI0029BFCFAD|nr:DMT family transporter [uncultured Ilyobacter sp.]
MKDKTKAILFMIFSGFAFGLMGATVKLSGDIPVFEKVFFRNFVSLLVAFYMIKKSKVSIFGKIENQKFLMLRSIMGLLGVFANFYAINHLVLADSTMLNKLSPFFVTIFAFIFLKERLSKIQIPALIFAFSGALLIIKPQFSLEVLPALSGAFSGMCAGAAYTVIRYLKGKEEPATIIFYFSLVSVLGTIPFLLFNFQVPSQYQLIFLLGTGVFAALGQFMITLAYKYAPASEVSIYNYFSVISSGIIGFILWGELPDSKSISGAIIITLVAVISYVYIKKEESQVLKTSA